MKKYKIVLFIIVFLSGLAFNGCLSVETKEYTFKLKDNKSGYGLIKYINIMHSDDSVSTVESDYRELTDTYLNGRKPEDELQGLKNVKKRLFEEDNSLCGEITFEFDDIKNLNFFNFNNKTWSYYLSYSLFGNSEKYFSSNGTYAGDTFPVIFWDGDERLFQFKTTINQPSEKTKSLLDVWKQGK
jgi:hypothetical protein